MKKKNFVGLFITTLVLFSPIFFLHTKVRADSEPVYTVTLKAGEGHGDDIIIKSTDENADVEVSDYNPSQFYNQDGVMYYVAPYLPETFSSPSQKQYSFKSWESGGSSYAYGEAIAIPEDTRSLTLTAQWDDSWFELQTPKTIKITEPGFTTFTCTLTDLHLGSYMEEYYSKDAENLTLRFQGGSLALDGKTLPYLVHSPESDNPNAEDFAESQKFTEEDKGKEFQMSVYVSPEDFENAKNGTYTGALKCIGLYSYRSTPMVRAERNSSTTTTKIFEGDSISIPLTLTLDPSEPENISSDSQTSFPKTGEQCDATALTLALLSISLTIALLSIVINKKCKYAAKIK